MKCPKCKGEGEFFWDDHCQGMFMECDMCNGTGEVQMTNEEWLRSCSTEELAEWITENLSVYADEWVKKDDKLLLKETWISWLKEKHHD